MTPLPQAQMPNGR